MKIYSWNINGIRSAIRDGFFRWFNKTKPDILCLQEVKISPKELPDNLKKIKGHHGYWSYPEKRGYSGVAIFSKQKPLAVQEGMGIEKFDNEGRVLVAEYKKFILVNVYMPHGRRDKSRLSFKMEFYDEILKFFDKLKRKKKKLVICGDFNVAHKEIDIARPKSNKDNTGFLPEERAWMDKVVKNYVDTYRYFNPKKVEYTFWSARLGARKKNIGWRLDYFIVPKKDLTFVKNAFILTNVMGSDHCPIGIDISI